MLHGRRLPHASPTPNGSRQEQCESAIVAAHPSATVRVASVSHAGGCKLYYLAKPGFTATELASVAGIHWLQLDRRATFDLIKSTRHPAFERIRDNRPPPCSIDNITYTYGSSDLAPVKRSAIGYAGL
jgi:hypothetical protein